MTENVGVYFFHIPKTAGMTVWKAIESAYDPESICPHWLWDQLIEAPREELDRYKVFRGHFYGFLEPYLGRELRKFTVLRDPVERTISYYYYIRVLKEHPNHKHAQALSLREFCLHEGTRYLVENYQAGYLASFAFTQDPLAVAREYTAEQRRTHMYQARLEPATKGIPHGELLAAARDGLSRFASVGIVEKLPEAMRAAGEALGCTFTLPEERQNVTPERPATQELDQATLDTIRELTSVDQELYDQIAGAVDRC